MFNPYLGKPIQFDTSFSGWNLKPATECALSRGHSSQSRSPRKVVRSSSQNGQFARSGLLGGGFKYFLFSPPAGEDYHFD